MGRKYLKVFLMILFSVAVSVFLIDITLPVNRINQHSDLVMMGDMNGDNAWTQADESALLSVVEQYFLVSSRTAWKVDVNANGILDEEDLVILRRLFEVQDPYKAEESARSEHKPFPRPRELFRYLSRDEFLARPLWGIAVSNSEDFPLGFVFNIMDKNSTGSDYQKRLFQEIYSEVFRVFRAWKKRYQHLSKTEQDYFNLRTEQCRALYDNGEWYSLLLRLIELSEDAETLFVQDTDLEALQVLSFRDRLRKVLLRPELTGDEISIGDTTTVLHEIERAAKETLGLSIEIETMKSPRNFLDPESYFQRAKWQYYKSNSSRDRFRNLIAFAQHDARYLRAVARTSRKHGDLTLDNHNIPMSLLFREAMRISGGNKYAAIGLLDEALRIPFSWVKRIPREKLPSSVAMENFLLPGNKEDGNDKSRHWNVFGGLAIYKTPMESVGLALAREAQDLRREGCVTSRCSSESLREFIRDMIANLQGIFTVLAFRAESLVD